MPTVRSSGEAPDNGLCGGDCKPGTEQTVEALSAHLVDDHGYKRVDLAMLRAKADARTAFQFDSVAQLQSLHTAAQMVGAPGSPAGSGGLA
jgi:hypothetical protein